MPLDLVLFDDSQLLKKYQKKLDASNYIFAKKFQNKNEINEIKNTSKFLTCHLIDSSNQKDINKFHNFADYIAVRGGDVTINKFAAGNKRVDFLLQPVVADRLSFDTGIANLLKQNSQAVVLPFSQLLNSKGFARTTLFKNYIFVAKVCKKFGITFNVFSCANAEHELRSPKDLLSLKNLLEEKK